MCVCVWGGGPGGRQWGGDAIAGLPYLEGRSPGPFAHIQNVDSRDRRRRELEPLEPSEPPEPPEPPEPSTSWWPVSSAEKKKNITLVRAGQVCAGRMGVWGVTEDAGAWRFIQCGGCPGRPAC